eukprot:jgi/Chrzof1/1854/Cz10g23230.t1
MNLRRCTFGTQAIALQEIIPGASHPALNAAAAAATTGSRESYTQHDIVECTTTDGHKAYLEVLNSSPAGSLTVSWNGISYSCTPDAAGNWHLQPEGELLQAALTVAVAFPKSSA